MSSTTHVAAGGIVGSAADRGPGAVHRATVRDMLLAWILTVPAAGVLGIIAFNGLRWVVP